MLGPEFGMHQQRIGVRARAATLIGAQRGNRGWKLGRGDSPRSGRGSWARAAWVGREPIARRLLPAGRAEGAERAAQR